VFRGGPGALTRPRDSGRAPGRGCCSTLGANPRPDPLVRDSRARCRKTIGYDLMLLIIPGLGRRRVRRIWKLSVERAPGSTVALSHWPTPSWSGRWPEAAQHARISPDCPDPSHYDTTGRPHPWSGGKPWTSDEARTFLESVRRDDTPSTPVGFENPVGDAGLRVSELLGSRCVFVNQPVEDLSPSESLGGEAGWRRLGWPAAQGAVRQVLVVVRQVLGEHLPQVSFTR